MLSKRTYIILISYSSKFKIIPWRELLQERDICCQGSQDQPAGTSSHHFSTLIRRLCPVQSTTTVVQQQFSNVFKGLGTLGEEYKIQLKRDAKAHVLFSPRNVPIPL